MLGQEKGGGAGGPDGMGLEAGGGMAGSQMGQGHWGEEGQIVGDRMARWQLLEVVRVVELWQGAGVQDGGQQGARSGSKGQLEARWR